MSNKSRGRLVVRETTKTTQKDASGNQTSYQELIETRTSGAFGGPNYKREEPRVARRTRKQKEMKVALGLLCSKCGEITGKAYGQPTLCEKCTLELQENKQEVIDK